MPEVESYSNPIAPPDQELPGPTSADSKRANLTNDDFRKLMMTPRPSAPSGASHSGGTTAPKVTSSSKQRERHNRRSVDDEDEERRQKRKSFYAQLRKEEEERQEEWAKKYRDRARERRDGQNPDYDVTEDTLPATSGYRAVAPNLEPSIMQERRKQVIQESKFLGGDMQHTHLVKGLDYVLLDKVRGEMQHKQMEEEELSLLEKKRQREVARKEFTDDLKFKTTLAKNVYRTLFLTKPPERNEFFTAGRMAYVFELDDEYAESDIPTTLLRSKADCPTQEITTLSTNDIVINKLTQILSYLRQGARAGKKGKRKDKGLLPIPSGVKVKELPLIPPPPLPAAAATAVEPKGESIYSDLGQYVFDPKASSSAHAARGNYFDQPAREKEVTAKEIHSSTAELVKAVSKRYSSKQFSQDAKKSATGLEGQGEAGAAAAATGSSSTSGKQSSKSGFGGLDAESHYAECYPGGMEEYDATYDSDEDVDFSKMDMGNKKGPVKRWDFDNEEEYNSYQSNREALPRAAFQYGVKMSEGRKTRRFGGGMSGKAKEKAKLNREWQQISALLEKRKRTGNEGASVSKKQKMD